MNIDCFWHSVLAQAPAAIRRFFHEDAVIRWHCSNEQFTTEEFIRANCEYPGDWEGEVERVERLDGLMVTVVRVWPKEGEASFHVTSFLRIEDEKIVAMDEYWADDGLPPRWRKELGIGRPIR